MPYLDSIDDQAQAIGAVNTIVIEHGRWHGLNTDAAGFLKHLRDSVDTEILSRQIAHSLVLGAGGAARSIVAALIMGGARDITICNRSTERTINLIEQLTPLANNVKIHALSWEKRHDAVMQAGLIVNTTTLGMDGYPPLELSLANAQDQTIVSDIVYAPLFTPLLQQAQQRGLVTVDGLGMLLGQAAEAFTHWFAISPTINEALRTRVMASHEKKQ
ncbi:MAG: shikimate dehydrogenase, partial [Rickettsiales bacterium]|nr:shikimate dehydrogenase [Rickettsiales bacterium]